MERATTSASDVTLAQVLDGLGEVGYGGSFLVDDAGRVACGACGTSVAPASLELHGLRRLEGASDPADMAIVLAVRCGDCEERGTVVVRYGPEAGPGDAALLVGIGPHPAPGRDVAEAAVGVEPAPSRPDVRRPPETTPAASVAPRRPSPSIQLRSVGPSLDATAGLDRIAEPLQRLVRRLLPAGGARRALRGEWLGHPVHPALTDLPIGFWTSALVLDLVGGRRARPAADLMVALGVASAVPTIVTGVADWSELDDTRRRTGVVHALANVMATVLYARSFGRRRSGHRAAGVALSVAGAAAATLGGLLGGHLVLGSSAPDLGSPTGS